MTTFWGYISNGSQETGQLAYAVGRESRRRGCKGGHGQEDRFMSAGLSREPCRKVCYAERQSLIPYVWSFHSAPSLSASARSISPSASCAKPSKLILGGRSWGDSRG